MSISQVLAEQSRPGLSRFSLAVFQEDDAQRPPAVRCEGLLLVQVGGLRSPRAPLFFLEQGSTAQGPGCQCSHAPGKVERSFKEEITAAHWMPRSVPLLVFPPFPGFLFQSMTEIGDAESCSLWDLFDLVVGPQILPQESPSVTRPVSQPGVLWKLTLFDGSFQD